MEKGSWTKSFLLLVNCYLWVAFWNLILHHRDGTLGHHKSVEYAIMISIAVIVMAVLLYVLWRRNELKRSTFILFASIFVVIIPISSFTVLHAMR